ncbi:retrovirus-related Pol polyprotein from transposon 297 [Trichonephila inaurata madagascariensis]|uniref:Retrovirus-related Pol polyprotein from transposon 297 n=1 Tax=Trichonephila inaurata madagascariensis TaxID=2747483 RepID=A0A8X6X828_9ARAC|nr:retrovirus-related Pol polyprotein from transposon 297 [Trichonephila inaurata madagascariensis]
MLEPSQQNTELEILSLEEVIKEVQQALCPVIPMSKKTRTYTTVVRQPRYPVGPLPVPRQSDVSSQATNSQLPSPNFSPDECSQQAIKTPSPIPSRGNLQYAAIDHPLPMADVVPADLPAVETRITKRGDLPWSLDVTVDGLPVKALVESVASSSVVSGKFRRYLKVMFPVHNHTVLKVANGSYAQPKGMCTLQIGISGRILPFEFIVLPDCSHDIILEWNFLKASVALIDCGRSELTLDDVGVTSEEVVLNPLHLCVMKDCRLPAYSIRKIPVVNCCREDSGNVIVEGSKLLALKKEVFMPSMLVTLRRGKTEIWVVDGQSQEKVIPQDICVTFAEPFCPDCIATISETSRVPTEISEIKQSFEFLKMISPDFDANQKRMLVVLQEYSEAFKERKNLTSQITVKHRINTGDNLPVKQSVSCVPSRALYNPRRSR